MKQLTDIDGDYESSITFALIKAKYFDRQLFPLVTTDMIYTNLVIKPNANMSVRVELVNNELYVSYRDRRDRLTVVEGGVEYHPMLVFNGKIQEIEIVDLSSNGGDGSGEGGGQCLVCMEKPANAAFVPCGHSQCCHDCANNVMRQHRACPMCRQPIQMVLKLYA